MGKSYREIGEKLGVSIGQAFNLVKDATRELQAKLNRKGYS